MVLKVIIEDALKIFRKWQTSKQYKLGNGEIISSYSQTSKQADLIVYDNNKVLYFKHQIVFRSIQLKLFTELLK